MNTREHNAHLLATAECIINTVDECETSWSNPDDRYHIDLDESIQNHAETAAEYSLVKLLLGVAWNDALLWARNVQRTIGG